MNRSFPAARADFCGNYWHGPCARVFFGLVLLVGLFATLLLSMLQNHVHTTWLVVIIAVCELTGDFTLVMVLLKSGLFPRSVSGRARNPSAIGKLFDVRQMIALLAIRDLPTTLRTKSRFTASPAAGTSVHFASNSSRRPPTSTTKSTSRVRSRQKNRLPHASGAALALAQLGKDKRFPDGACPRRLTESFLGADVQQRAKEAGIRQVEFGTLDDGLGAVREPWLKQHDLPGSLERGQPMVRGGGSDANISR